MFLYHHISGIFDIPQNIQETTIWQRHRDVYGIRWLSNRATCSMPAEWAEHKTKVEKNLHGLTVAQSKKLFGVTNQLFPVSSGK